MGGRPRDEGGPGEFGAGADGKFVSQVAKRRLAGG
jgi:hypothetical protein